MEAQRATSRPLLGPIAREMPTFGFGQSGSSALNVLGPMRIHVKASRGATSKESRESPTPAELGAQWGHNLGSNKNRPPCGDL